MIRFVNRCILYAMRLSDVNGFISRQYYSSSNRVCIMIFSESRFHVVVPCQIMKFIRFIVYFSMTNFTVFHTACKLSAPKVIKIKIVCYSITGTVSIANRSCSSNIYLENRFYVIVTSNARNSA